MEIYTYLIQSLVNHSYYTGISADPLKRLKEHSQGKVKIISRLKPYNLVYIKIYSSYSEARRHEKCLKRKNRIYKEKLAQLAPPMQGGVK